MTASHQERTRVNFIVLLVSAITWIMLLVNPGSIIPAAFCQTPGGGISLDSFQTQLLFNPISSLALGWALMLVAMMAPTLISPIHHIREHSFKRRRIRSVALFLVGYGTIWMAAGVGLVAIMLTVNIVAPESLLPALIVGVIAAVWQCSPTKQRCLNRGHHHRALAAFGVAADLDALRFGIAHGAWCAASCWGLMLLPMLLPQVHFSAMALVTYVMVSERLEQPRPLTWSLRFPIKLVQIAVAQTRMRLYTSLSKMREFAQG